MTTPITLPTSETLKDEYLLAEGGMGVITQINDDGVLGLRFNVYPYGGNRWGHVKTEFLGMVALFETDAGYAIGISDKSMRAKILCKYADDQKQWAIERLDDCLSHIYAICDFENDLSWLDDRDDFIDRVSEILDYFLNQIQ